MVRLERKAGDRGEKPCGEDRKNVSTEEFGAGTYKYSVPSGSVALRAEGTRGSCV